LAQKRLTALSESAVHAEAVLFKRLKESHFCRMWCGISFFQNNCSIPNLDLPLFDGLIFNPKSIGIVSIHMTFLYGCCSEETDFHYLQKPPEDNNTSVK